jgi:hypothetical protein
MYSPELTCKELNDLQKVAAGSARSCDAKAHTFIVPMWIRLWYNHSYASFMLFEKYRLSPRLL